MGSGWARGKSIQKAEGFTACEQALDYTVEWTKISLDHKAARYKQCSQGHNRAVY